MMKPAFPSRNFSGVLESSTQEQRTVLSEDPVCTRNVVWVPIYTLPILPFFTHHNKGTKLSSQQLLSTSQSSSSKVPNNFKMSIIPSFRRNSNSVFDPFLGFTDLWDPFKDFPFPSSSLSTFPRENSAFVNTRIDWKETPEAHVFKADIPGLKKEEVKVEIEDDRVLQISGERKIEKEDKSDNWHRVERSSGKFSRRFRLPENAKVDEIKAAMENGVLSVTVPKVDVKKPDVKSIEISG
ncbi:hypothetical protein ACLB2K_031057 [Fragaria x ananassa]